MTTATHSTLDTVVDHFNTDGYAVIRGFYSPAETQEMLGEIERYIRDDLPRLPEGAAFYEDKSDPNTLFRLDRFDAYNPWARAAARSERITALAAALLASPVEPQHVQMFGKAPIVGKETPAHQDSYYWMIDPSRGLTFWLPLDTVDEENGCVRYVPGSHKQGLRPHGKGETFGFSLGLLDFDDEDRSREVAIHARPGDLIVHSGLTVHRADPNTSPRRRWALGLVYWQAQARRDEARAKAHHRAIEAAWRADNRL